MQSETKTIANVLIGLEKNQYFLCIKLKTLRMVWLEVWQNDILAP